ncbi:MAG: GAF domain-containing protein, partial [Chloroflexi bacterium]|nr:GAF domain-containing protein [Chloroflexota bacterium]
MPRRRRRLRTTIIAWSFIPASIILGIVALAHFVSFQDLTEDLVFERNRDLAVLLGNQYRGELEELAQPLRVLASDFEIISSDPVRQQSALDAAYNQLWDYDAGVIVLSAEGQITAAGARRPDLRGQDWSTQAFFQQLTRHHSLTVSDISPVGSYTQDVVILAAPIYDDRGTFVGAVAGMYAVGEVEARITTFYATIKKLAVDASSTAYLVDGTGRVVFHPEGDVIGTARADQAAVDRALSGRTGTLRYQKPSGQELIASYAPIPDTPWHIIVEEDWDALAAASIPYQRRLLALLVLGLVVPAVVVALGVRRVTHPVYALIEAAQAVANGDFSRRITPHWGDEIAELADQFNRMAVQLEESYATLEQRVAHRTRDLAALNAITAVASRSLDINHVLRAALDKTLAVTGMAVGAAYRLDAAQQTLHLVAQRGLPEEFETYATAFPRAASVAGQVTDALRPALLRLEAYPEGELKRILVAQNVRLSLSIPLVSKEQVLGFINLGSQDVREVSPEELALMASIGQQVGVAVENAQLYEHAEEVAAAAERSRLARELHDAVSQTLFSAHMIAGVLPRLWERDQVVARAQLEQLHQLTRGAQAEMRILLLELRPEALVATALSDLLQQLAQATSSRATVPVSVDVVGTCDPPLESKVALYRIAQEALNNVVKHADAEMVHLSLNAAVDTITLTVADDGCGFNPESVSDERLGQRSMRERAAAIGAHLTV